MKNWILSLMLLFAGTAVFAQEVETDEQETQDLAEQITEKQIQEGPYYQNLQGFRLNISNHIATRDYTVGLPVNVNLEFTASKNITAGVLLTYMRTTHQTKLAENVNRVEDGGIKYNQFMFGLKANYHLLPMIQKWTRKPMLTDYLDVYLTSWVGYSMVFSGKDEADVEYMQSREKIRGGIGLGVRSMVLPRFGFFIEGGYSSYSYASFGLTAVLK